MSGPLERGLAFLRAPALELSFAMRSTLRWSRGPVVLVDEPKHDLLDHLPATERPVAAAAIDALVQRFDLRALAERSTRTTFASNLARLQALSRLAGDRRPPSGPDQCVRAADFGCGDFHYATALQRWLADGGGGSPRAVVLRGIEIDGYGLYRDGHSRIDHARAHAALAERGGDTVRFEVADASAVRLPEQDVVTLFFPFLGPFACLRWGLPLSRLRPRALLDRALASLRPGGWLVVANQTVAERRRLDRLLASRPVTLVAEVPMACDWVPWRARTCDQVLSLWRREPAVP